MGGIGALIGAVLMGRSRAPRRPVTWIYLWWTLATLAVAGYGLATRAWGLALAAYFVYGAEAVGAVVWATLKQVRVPNSMLGRVSSIDWCLSSALLPLSYALTVPWPIFSVCVPRWWLLEPRAPPSHLGSSSSPVCGRARRRCLRPSFSRAHSPSPVAEASGHGRPRPTARPSAGS